MNKYCTLKEWQLGIKIEIINKDPPEAAAVVVSTNMSKMEKKLIYIYIYSIFEKLRYYYFH